MLKLQLTLGMAVAITYTAVTAATATGRVEIPLEDRHGQVFRGHCEWSVKSATTQLFYGSALKQTLPVGNYTVDVDCRHGRLGADTFEIKKGITTRRWLKLRQR